MMKSLEITGFRQFTRYQLNRLARVNLLVGENCAGKSSILEAITLLATGGAPWAFANLAWFRGEIVDDVDPTNPASVKPQPTVVHFFQGHAFDEGSSFAIRKDGETELEAEARKGMFPGANAWGLSIIFGPCGAHIAHHAFPISGDGVLRDELRKSSRTVQGAISPVNFLALSPRGFQPLIELWDNVLENRREKEVAEALKIIDDAVEDVALQSGDAAARIGGAVGIFVGRKGSSKRIPLASLGEGMFRLFELGVGLVASAGGVLLIDEVDTGLHYSIMGELWRLVVETARRHNVQVFATSHSYDCFRGLAWLCGAHPELATDVALHKIEPRLDESISLGAEKIQITFDQNIEVR